MASDRGTSITSRDATIAVVVPVLDRPHRAAPLVESLADATPEATARVVFVCSPNDAAQIAACRATDAETLIADWEPGLGDYQRKINLGVRATSEAWIFTGADDLAFRAGWAEEAIRMAEQFGAGMVGTDDLGNGLVRAGRHSTHSLFRRDYVVHCGTIDEPGKIYHEGYGHQGCDVEAYETAVARDCFVFAAHSQVEHLHPFWGKGSLDTTYEKGLSTTNDDKRLLDERRHLWQRIAA